MTETTLLDLISKYNINTEKQDSINGIDSCIKIKTSTQNELLAVTTLPKVFFPGILLFISDNFLDIRIDISNQIKLNFTNELHEIMYIDVQLQPQYNDKCCGYIVKI